MDGRQCGKEIRGRLTKEGTRSISKQPKQNQTKEGGGGGAPGKAERGKKKVVLERGGESKESWGRRRERKVCGEGISDRKSHSLLYAKLPLLQQLFFLLFLSFQTRPSPVWLATGAPLSCSLRIAMGGVRVLQPPLAAIRESSQKKGLIPSPPFRGLFKSLSSFPASETSLGKRNERPVAKEESTKPPPVFVREKMKGFERGQREGKGGTAEGWVKVKKRRKYLRVNGLH